LGWAYVENGRLPEGLEHIRRAIETSKEESAEMYYHLADTYRRLDRGEEALQAIDRALALAVLGSGEMSDRLLETLRLLEPESHHDAATRSAALEIARKTAGMKLNRRTVYTDPSGIAIKGFDPVAYHTVGEAIRGKLVHHAIWRDAVWLFATDDNKALFESNPERYAPALGGFCSNCFRYGVDVRLGSVPFYWHIHDGKLFLFASSDGGDEFVSGGPARAERALRDWSLSTFDTDATPSAPSIYMLLLQEAAAD
jgi:tetratricopeptide (TPR) repeat protein